MTATSGLDGVMVLWNAFVGFFVAYAIPHTLHRSCCDNGCFGISALGARTSSVETVTSNSNELERFDHNSILVCADTTSSLLEDWSSAVWWSLKLDVTHSICSKELKRALFAEDSETTQEINPPDATTILPHGNTCGMKSDAVEKENSEIGTETTSSPWIVRGIPERPLYREVAKRLLEWHQQCFSHESSSSVLVESTETNHCKVMVPAKALGFEEMAVSQSGRILLPDLPPFSIGDIPSWLLSCHREDDQNADAIIYKLLGIRNTVGSLLPREKRLLLLPSKGVLLKAAGVFHEKKQKPSARTNAPQKQQQHLTVAAKARSKHAHRAIQDTSFFGVARGPVAKQNQQAEELVQYLLVNCVWINCHVFGGLTNTKKNDNDFSSWVVEIRQEQGYGARWRVEEYGNGDADHGDGNSGKFSTKTNRPPSVKVTFRGFLEPQMEGGHERRWRH